jgi:hypothetical protein
MLPGFFSVMGPWPLFLYSAPLNYLKNNKQNFFKLEDAALNWNLIGCLDNVYDG